MKIDKFWVVTQPRELSELADICFEADVQTLALQFKGGLLPDEIIGLYTESHEAKNTAQKALSNIGKRA